MLDRDLLVDIYTKLGKVETGIDNIREDHRDLRFMISKNECPRCFKTFHKVQDLCEQSWS